MANDGETGKEAYVQGNGALCSREALKSLLDSHTTEHNVGAQMACRIGLGQTFFFFLLMFLVVVVRKKTKGKRTAVIFH